jgi:hypothetical protein
VAIDPGVRHQWRHHFGCAGQPPVDVEHVLGRTAGVQRGQCGRRALGAHAARHKLYTRAFHVVDDAAAAGVVTDVGEEVDAAAQPGQTHSHVQWAAADVLADDPPVPLDDVDQRLA